MYKIYTIRIPYIYNMGKIHKRQIKHKMCEFIYQIFILKPFKYSTPLDVLYMEYIRVHKMTYSLFG